jgi:hypothetical protein
MNFFSDIFHFSFVKKQLAFMAGRQRSFFLEEDDDELSDLVGNMKLPAFYHELARDLSVEEVKAPKDIYKMHLIENRNSMLPIYLLGIIWIFSDLFF